MFVSSHRPQTVVDAAVHSSVSVQPNQRLQYSGTYISVLCAKAVGGTPLDSLDVAESREML